jgi:hypothetical protein
MTQKSVAKPSADPSSKVVVFGLDSNWRPHAAWFPHTQADQARAAAKQLRLNVIEVANGRAAELVGKLPAGQIHAAGPAMVPPIREDLYEKVVATINPHGEAGQEPGEPIATDLPSTYWDAIKPGTSSSPKPDRRLVRIGCRWPNGRQAHPPVPGLPWLSKVHRAGADCRPTKPDSFLTIGLAHSSGCSVAARGAANRFMHGEKP